MRNSNAAGYVSSESEFSADVMRGLGRSRKELPCKYLYDQRVPSFSMPSPTWRSITKPEPST